MLLFFCVGSLSWANSYQPKDGDVIFQTSLSSQSKAIQLATDSPYSHVGIVYMKNGKAFVYEAIKTVSLTPLSRWKKRGKDHKIMVMRTKLSANQLRNMKKVGESFRGRPYDLKFAWDNKKIYCSELVWKIYKEGANIELSPVSQWKDYNFKHPKVYPIVKKRWKGAPNQQEKVVAPSDLAKSKKLQVVYSDF